MRLNIVRGGEIASMKIGDLLKYNSALFLTGLFAVFITSATAGLLLQNNPTSSAVFVWSSAAILLGMALGLWTVKDFRGPSRFAPDYFILVLPITALALIFSAVYSRMWQYHAWNGLLWGLSLGLCFGLLQAVNPDRRHTGFPATALGAFTGAGLAMAALSGHLSLYDIYAVTSCLVVVTPLFCFPERLSTRRAALATAALIVGIGALAVYEAVRFRNVQTEFSEMKSAARQTGFKQNRQNTEITAFLPIMLQQGYPYLRLLVAEDRPGQLSAQFRQLPFVGRLIRIDIDARTRRSEPFAAPAGLRRLLTGHLSAQAWSGERQSPVDLLLILPYRPLSRQDAALFTSEFYRLTAAFLGRNGILATTAATPLEAAALAKTMRTAFAHTVVFPGRNNDELLVAAAAFPFCTDYNELDRRATLRLEQFGFCQGMLSVFLSPVRQAGLNHKVERQMALASTRINSDLQPYWRARLLAHRLQQPLAALLLIPLAGYLLLRFLLSRRTARRLVFGSWENGLYCGGLIAAAWLVFQGAESRLFLYLGWLLAIFLLGLACAYGRQVTRPGFQWLLALGSVLIPVVLLGYDQILFQEFYLAIVSGLMFLVGVFGGSAAARFAALLPTENYPSGYLHWTVIGMVCGGLVVWVLLALPEYGLIGTVTLLAVLRLPLIFRRFA